MPDLNVLVYAHRQDDARHESNRDWLQQVVDGPEPFALSVLVAVGFLTIVTNPKIYADATPLPLALAAIEQLAGHPGCRVIAPTAGHLAEVVRLCRAVGATGKAVADAQHATLAVGAGCTWVTRDGDFARFVPHGLRWHHLVLD